MHDIAHLVHEVEAFEPFNEQEQRDQRLILHALKDAIRQGSDALQALFGREDPAHVTASAWIVSPDRAQVLMAYHNIYKSWSWLGGHADGDLDLGRVAMREAREESGLEQLHLVTPHIFSLEILCVNGHEKRGAYVSSHLHLNATYLIEADPTQPIRIKPDENSQIAWLKTQQIHSHVSEEWMRERIYPKLVYKAQR